MKALFSTLKDNIQIVVLNACFSKIQGEAINEVIDYVIGMNTSIGDRAAITFASSFYRALGFDRTIEEAFDQAKTALLLEDIPEENTPELLIKQGVLPHRKLSATIANSDIELARKYRKVFDRPAFRTSCISELSLRELTQAIDDVQASLNTGSLYSRSGKLLGTVPEKHEFQSIEIQQALDKITSRLSQLKRSVVQFHATFRQIHPRYTQHQNFYSMIMSLGDVADGESIRDIVRQMDAIDENRNDILHLINPLLEKSGERPLQLIELSSEILKKWENSIAKHLH